MVKKRNAKSDPRKRVKSLTTKERKGVKRRIQKKEKKLEGGKRKREDKRKKRLREKKIRPEERRKKRLEEKKTLAEQAKLEKAEEGKYVYGIIPYKNRERSFGSIGIENNRVYIINYKDIAAVVSDASVKDYPVTEEYTRKHEKVASIVLKKCSVVPAAFGQVFKNQRILRTLMKKVYKTLKESMKLVDNKVELGVKAILSKEIAEALDEKKKKQFEEKATEIYSKLNKNADESVKGRLFSNRLILNSSFLVDKRKMKKFSNDIEMLSKKYKDMKISYSGPWPPYSFVYIKIGAKGIETGKKEVK